MSDSRAYNDNAHANVLRCMPFLLSPSYSRRYHWSIVIIDIKTTTAKVTRIIEQPFEPSELDSWSLANALIASSRAFPRSSQRSMGSAEAIFLQHWVDKLASPAS